MPAIGPDFHHARRRWLYGAQSDQSILSAVAFLLLFLFLQMLLPVIPSILDIVSKRQGNPIFANQGSAFIVMLLVMIPTGFLVSWLVVRVGRSRGGEFLLPELLRLPNLGWAGWAVIVFGFVFLMGSFAILTRFLFGDLTSMGEVEKFVAEIRDRPEALLIVPLAIGIAAPMAEEFLFRGPFFVRLKQSKLGAIGTLVLTSAIWASIHLTQPLINIAIIFGMGLALGTLLLRFGSIWVPVACHCVWNLLTAIVLFNAELPAQLPQ